jgi:hypothetical protein
MQLGANKGSTLSQGAYLTVGDYLFAMSPTQPYGFCLVLASDGDLQFWYGTTGTGLNRQYGSVLQDFSGAISKGPGFQPGQAASYFAIMQSDGNFCVYSGTGPADNHGFCWSTSTNGKGSQPYAAMLHTDGNLHIGGGYQSGTMNDLWKTTMGYPSMRVATGSRLTSGQWMAPGDEIVASGTYTYAARMDYGDLQLLYWPSSGDVGVGGKNIQQYCSAVANGHGIVYGSNLGNMFAIMQDDGNFCLYNGTDPGHRGPVYWGILSQSKQQGNYVLQLNGDGTLTACSQDTGSAPYWTSAQGTGLAIQIRDGAGQTVHVSGPYDVVQFQQPMTVRIVYPSLIPVAGASVTFGQGASTMGEVNLYFAPGAMLENCHTTITTDSNGFASTPMWGQSVLGGPNQPGSVGLSITVAGFGGYPGDGNGSVNQYVFRDGQ